MTSFMSESETAQLGFLSVGHNVRVSRFARIYGASRIAIGDDVRIDDFVILSAGEAGFEIGTHVHLAAHSSIMGAGRVTLGDFSGLSVRVVVLSSTDDFSGLHLTGPTVPARYLCVRSESISIGRHAVIGAGSVILPGAAVGDGAAIGALSVVKAIVPAFEIHAGCPTRKVGERSRELLALERDLSLTPRVRR